MCLLCDILRTRQCYGPVVSPKAVPPVKCVSYIVILRNALLVENLDLIPGYRCSEQQDAAEFL